MIYNIENCKKVPGFDTVVYIARELNISLDPILFSDAVSGGISKSVADFFRDKDEAEIQKYIALCHAAEAIHAEKPKIGV